MTSVTSNTFESSWNQWHTEREAYYGDSLGWVSLTGIYWLTDEFETVADLPGRWRADADAVYIEGLNTDGSNTAGSNTVASNTVASNTVGWNTHGPNTHGPNTHGSNTEDRGAERLEPVEGAPGILVEDGERRIEVIRRTGSVALRVHDPKSPHLADFDGIPSYAPNEKWSVTGTFRPFAEAKIVTTGAVVEGLEHHHTAVGVIDFDFGGEKQQFVAFGSSGASGTARSSGKPGGLQVLFTDATSGVTTYPAARSLAVADPAEDGTVALDFNRASNLPCAFTDYATCPVAPAENRLSVAVEAGEKNPRPSAGGAL